VLERQPCGVQQGVEDVFIEAAAIIIGPIEIGVVETNSGQQSWRKPVVGADGYRRQLRS
jgi:hypothetical protein